MEAIHHTYAVLDGAYWLDDTGNDTGTDTATDTVIGTGTGIGIGTDGDRAHRARCAIPLGSDAPDTVPHAGQEGLLERLQSALTCAARVRAAMLTCSMGTVIAGAEAALRR
ncbi:hypothetical protein [Streptomyces sp. NPDC002587]